MALSTLSGGSAARPPGRMGIGDVLRRLRADFPDVSISKIRFLETEGLVEPERTASGYRKFSPADLERLRYVLTAQRDHYLPLKVIREHLDAMSRGLEPPTSAGETPRAPAAVVEAAGSDAPAPDIWLSRDELLANSGLSEAQLAQLDEFGLVQARSGSDQYDATALAIATAAAAMSAHGLEPRHLRAFKTAADREAGLIDQVCTPVARQRDADAAARAAQLREELAALSSRLHGALLRRALESHR
jgi:DNA-binding transcriptional MerR regulator